MDLYSMTEDDNLHDTNGTQVTGAFSYKLPGPGRLVVPPPHVNHVTGSPRRFELNGKLLLQDDVDLSFLQSIDHNYLFEGSINNSAAWTYAMRREFTEILPFIYLGPMSAARDRGKLREAGITMLLAIQHRNFFPATMARGPMKAAEELGLAKDFIEVRANAELIAAFPHAISIINKHLYEFHLQHPERMPKVLIFCESGNDRSAAVVAAYLMQMYQDIDLVSACQIINLRRFSANVEEEMKQYLLSYGEILQAQRETRASMPIEKGTLSNTERGDGLNITKQKRPRSSDDDDEMHLDDDAERFLGRNSAPFVEG